MTEPHRISEFAELPGSMKMRSMLATDADEVFAIKRDGLKSVVDDIWGWDDYQQREWHDKWMIDQAQSCEIVEIHKEIVGFITIDLNKDHVFLGLVCLAKAWQGFGLGRLLVDAAQRLAVARNQPLDLSVLDGNQARRLYERCGFGVEKVEAPRTFMRWPYQLSHGNVVLRRIEASDTDRLTEILSDSSVSQWWGPHPRERVVKEIIEDNESSRFAITLDGKVEGYIQMYLECETDYRFACVDLFVSAESQGKGLGPAAIEALAEFAFTKCGQHRMTIDPASENEYAIRAYEKAGFQTIGTVRQYWLDTRNNTWKDCHFMDRVRSGA